MSRILMVVTAADSLELADGSSHPTGFWAEELVVAHRDLLAEGHEVTITTPQGGRAPVDPGSLAGPEGDDLRAYLDGIRGELEHPAALEAMDALSIDAIVIPGGHGPMTDLAADPALGSLLADADARGVLIAPFCHGPAALLSAVRADGTFVFAGRRLAVFTDEEEAEGGLGANAPWHVAGRLSSLGAVLDTAEPWASHVVHDGNLISGQNPQSSGAVAAAVLAALA